MAEKKDTARGNGSTAAVNVPASPAGNVAATAPPGSPAALSVAPFGGNRGGKKRTDGLVPGSPEAEKADRDKDAERKRLARAASPPALPSPVSSVANPGPASTPGATALPGSPAPGQSVPVPWDPNTLKPLLEQIIDGAEKARVAKRRAQAVAVGMPGPVVEESASLATFPGSAKTGLAVSGANGVAQIMNSLKISGKFQDPSIAVLSIASIVVSMQQSDAKFEEMIAEFKKSKAAEEPKKP